MLEDHLAISSDFYKISIIKKMDLLGYELVSKLYYTMIFKEKNAV